MRLTILLAVCLITMFTGRPRAADAVRFPFEVSETAGIRRRNDVVTIRSAKPEIVGHPGGFRISHAGKQLPAQVRLVASVEGSMQVVQLVVDFIDHFQPFETRAYVLDLSEAPTPDDPAEGLTLKDTEDAWQIDSSGVATWTIRKDLQGLFDFSWKETDYIADNSAGLYFDDANHQKTPLATRAPTYFAVERQGPFAISLVFGYDDWPPGLNSRVRLEFPRTKSWIHASWTTDADPAQALILGAELNLRLEGPEALIDFGAGDFVYTTVTNNQSAILVAGPREGETIDWSVRHGDASDLAEIFVAPRDVPTPRVHGWAHVMDDKRCTALAIANFGEVATDSIGVQGNGKLDWQRNFSNVPGDGPRQLEFWLHFVTMPVHIGARTSPRSMQEPLQAKWLTE